MSCWASRETRWVVYSVNALVVATLGVALFWIEAK